MQARKLSPLAGWRWIVAGFAIYLRNPPLLTALTMSYLLIVVVFNLIPLIGSIVVAVCLPGASVVLANGVRAAALGRQADKDELMRGIRPNLRALVRLGFLHLGGSLLVVLLSTVLFGDTEVSNSAPSDQQFIEVILQLLPLVLPLLLLMWFPPYLIAWNNLTLGKAVFFGLVGVWRNLPVFIVYFAGASLLGVGLPLLVLQAFGGEGDLLSVMLRTAVRMSLLFVLGPSLVASLYVSYVQIFGPGGPEQPDERREPDA